jgi:hypothetical protein
MVKKVVLIVFGVVGILLGGFLTLGGGVLVAITSGDGFLDTGQVTLATPTHALVSDPTTLRSDSPLDNDSGPDIQYRITVSSSIPVFVGIAPATAVASYFDNVEVDQVTRLDFRPFRLESERQPGGRSPAAPDGQTFWSAKVSGAGQQTLLWDSRGGDYRFVLMAADGSSNFSTNAVVGIRVPFLHGLGIGLLIGGIVALLVGLGLLIWGIRTKRTPPAPAYPGSFGQYASPYPPPGPYGYADPGQPPYPPPGPYGAPPGGAPPPYYGQQQAYGQPPYGQQASGPYGQQAPAGEPSSPYGPPSGAYGQPATGTQPVSPPSGPGGDTLRAFDQPAAPTPPPTPPAQTPPAQTPASQTPASENDGPENNGPKSDGTEEPREPAT